jgi:DNA-binding beta-propeller fold protein YncE
VIPAALLTVAIITAAIVITRQQHKNSNGPQITPPTSQTQTAQPAYGPQVTLPFTGLNKPDGVAADTAGDLDVTDTLNNRAVKLAAGSATPAVLPFTGLNLPAGVAVDAAGKFYVVDARNNRVVKLPVG